SLDLSRLATTLNRLERSIQTGIYIGVTIRLAIGIKSLLDAVRITAAYVCVNAAQLELVLLRDFKENMLSVYYC
ncbi:hypothetical protein Tco_0780741, partial [Tanacetum coccineum]